MSTTSARKLWIRWRAIPAEETEAPRTSVDPEVEPLWARYLAVPGLFITTVISTTLIIYAPTHQISSGSFPQLVINYRSVTQVIVQVLAHALGLIHVFVLTTLINFSTRLSFSRRPVSLDYLKWWNSVCHLRTDWSLPIHLLVPLLVFIG